MMSENDVMSPKTLEHSLIDVQDVDEKIQRISDVLVDLLAAIGCPDGISKVRNIALTLVVQEEVFQRLLNIYRETHGIYIKLNKLLGSGEYDTINQGIIRSRVEEIVKDQLFLLQREVFFKIVNAKEVADGEKNEDGPALLFPGVEKVKSSIIRNIQQQTNELYPLAVDICQKFRGIADSYVDAEQLPAGEKSKYDTIYQTFEQEKKVSVEHLKDIKLSKLNDTSYLDTLINSFEQLKVVYQQKARSLDDIESISVSNYSLKIGILEKGCKNADMRIKPLQVIKNMAERFPALEKQLDFFADSHYQARAVLNVFEEVKLEMSKLFTSYNLESFTAVSLLKYKLNGISHMYESIHYYYAVIQIEKDMMRALSKRYFKPEDGDIRGAVKQKLETIGISGIIQSMHQSIALMNSQNNNIHLAFMLYQNKPDLMVLKSSLKDRNQKINILYKKVKNTYKKAQKIFSSFLIEDLGATDLESQFSMYLKSNRDSPEAGPVRRGFSILLSTKRTTLASLEKEFMTKFAGKVPVNRISAMSLLKVKKDFLKELLKQFQEYSHVQDIFLEVLKEFIELQDEKEKRRVYDNSVFWMIERMAGGTFHKFKTERSAAFKKIFQKTHLTDQDITVAFLAANITPQEIESFSRLLPALPRNELQLDSPYGRLLLNIITLYHEQLRLKAASGDHVVERVYEKREQLKLISNMSALLKTSADPFILKIEKEEKKTNHLIALQRLKYRKELGEIIKYWQFLIQEQIEPGQGQRGQFRRFSIDEKWMMVKYISPEQLSLIDRQLESSFDLEAEGELLTVESFLLEIVSGLFQLFKEDQRVKAEFEAFEGGKKIRHRNLQDNDDEDLLASKRYVPSIKLRLAGRKEESPVENLAAAG